jgi:hypothetical protein
VFSHFQKDLRQNLALILAGMAFGSFGFHLYLWSYFMDHQPRNPNPAQGLVYSMNNHGWSYYLSATQATELGMLMYMSFALFVFGAIAYGRHPAKQAWEKHRMPDRGSGIYFVISLLFWGVVLWVSGYSLASFLVSNGLSLQPW